MTNCKNIPRIIRKCLELGVTFDSHCISSNTCEVHFSIQKGKNRNPTIEQIFMNFYKVAAEQDKQLRGGGAKFVLPVGMSKSLNYSDPAVVPTEHPNPGSPMIRRKTKRSAANLSPEDKTAAQRQKVAAREEQQKVSESLSANGYSYDRYSTTVRGWTTKANKIVQRGTVWATVCESGDSNAVSCNNGYYQYWAVTELNQNETANMQLLALRNGRLHAAIPECARSLSFEDLLRVSGCTLRNSDNTYALGTMRCVSLPMEVGGSRSRRRRWRANVECRRCV